MKKLLLLIIFVAAGCSSDNEENCNCEGQFYNETTNKIMHQPTDCDRTPPSKDWIFVKCLTIDY